jgi:hypothetical protein
MDALETLEVYAEKTAAELDDARSKLSVEVASIEVVKDADWDGLHMQCSAISGAVRRMASRPLLNVLALV